jgi:hypothetical protein
VLFRFFPDLESDLKIERKSDKIRKNPEYIYHNVGHVFQDPMLISKYGKGSCTKYKNRKKKKQKKLGTVGDDVGWCFQGPLHISIFGR